MSEKWVKVLVTSDVFEGEIVRDLLESGGISVRLVSLRVGPYPVSIGRMGEVRLMVREEDETLALKALEAFERE